MEGLVAVCGLLNPFQTPSTAAGLANAKLGISIEILVDACNNFGARS